MSMSMPKALSKSPVLIITTATQRLQKLTVVDHLVVDVEQLVELVKFILAVAWRHAHWSLAASGLGDLRRHSLFLLLIIVDAAGLGSFVGRDLRVSP